MNDKNLDTRYFFYFIISFFLIIVFLDFFKERELKNALDNYKKTAITEYKRYFNSYQNISELIYFNEFIKDKKLIEILKNRDNLEENLLKEKIKNHFDNSFLLYKTLGLEDVSFYTAQNFQILSMKENSQDNFTSKIVENIVSNKKELVNYKRINSEVLILFSKPIFDDKLKFLGVINMEFSLHTLINKLSQNTNLVFREIISDNFHLNEKIFHNMKEYDKKEMITSLSKQKDISLVLSDELTKVPVIFFPIDKSKFNKNNIYLLSYNLDEDNELTKISKYFDYLLLFLIIGLTYIIFLLYKKSSLGKRKFFIEKKYNDLFEQVNEYIIKVEIDLNRNITFATKPFYELSGYSKEEILGKNIEILKHSDVSNIFFEKLWKDLEENNIWKGEIKNQDKYGNSYWIKSVIFPKYDVNNKIEGYNSIRVNITDTKQLEKINRLLKEDLSNRLNDIKLKDKSLVDNTKVQLMSKILDSLGHQWKIPISKISSEVEKIHKINRDNFDKNSLIIVEKNIELELKNLSDMLNEIKYLFSKRNSEKTNLLSVVSESIFGLKDELKSHNIKVRFDIKPEIFMMITFLELKNIVVNILKNCMEQTLIHKCDNVNIYISAISEDIEDNQDVVIKIEDNIKGNNKKNILDEMQTSSEEKYFDTHLYLSKLFIEKNKGLFWCNNTPYSTIYFIKLNKEGNYK